MEIAGRGRKWVETRSTYDDSVGGDVQGSCSEDRGGGRATPPTGLLVGRVWNTEKNICDFSNRVIAPFPPRQIILNYIVSRFV